ncbi:MAG: hypothetical protein EPGJADBJ_01658 [Saprospiraceae bacterium]|nr:hypothetical protein [Saprospiraceae bacterium]
MTTKAFRLFVSSTFNDFIEEREILQKTIFPEIEQYCLEKGYTFQGVDLRWGIQEEAQLDQKTMDICQEEIRICKSYPHPNFLIMVGERYGWVPLPYRIEQIEFEGIARAASLTERDALSKWYELDNNQVPPSYILCERMPPYDTPENWENEEAVLREIFQSAVQKIDLSASEKEKYFQSATEQEAVEGMGSFSVQLFVGSESDETIYNRSDLDPDNVIAFFKESDDKNKRLPEALIRFSEKLKAALNTRNIVHIKSNDRYLINFETKIIKLLKTQIAREITVRQDITPLEEEKRLHEAFRGEKVKHFTGREEPLKQIQQYLNLKTEAEPLIIYSASGMGKSTLIAKAIEQTNVRTIFRFVGISPNSRNSQQLLVSIIKELDTRAMVPDEIDTSGFFAKQRGDALVNFSYQVFPILYGGIEKPVVIFIDGLDQLENYDEILWLPKKLPAHVKIILTALSDRNYPQASQYFETLRRKKFTNLLRLPDYQKDEAQIMLSRVCAGYDRTLQPWQTDYVLSQFAKTASPLCLKIAAELAKNWKSTADMAQCRLADDLKSLIRQYFEALHTDHHHHRELVRRVAGYLVASVDGLSEAELLELLAADEAFLDEVAPNTYHNRNFQKLPYSIWIRLFMQLNPFLSIRRVDDSNLYQFFHREFDASIREQYGTQTLMRELIRRVQTLLQKYKSQPFDRTRYGKLYLKIIAHYKIQFAEEVDFFKQSAEFPAKLDKSWQDAYRGYGIHFQLELNFEDRGTLAIACGEAIYLLMKKLSAFAPEKGYFDYIPLLANMANAYRANNEADKAIEFDEEKLRIAKSLFEQDKPAYLEVYVTSLQALASSYLEKNRAAEALRLDEEALNTLRPFYQAEPERWEWLYTMNINSLATSYKSQNRLLDAVKIEEEALLLHKKRFDQSQDPDTGYLDCLDNLAQSYRAMGRMDEAIRHSEEVVKVVRSQHIVNPKPWADQYVRSLNQLSVSYSIQHRTQEAIELGKEALHILKPMFVQEPMRWVSRYVANLINLGMVYSTAGNFAKAIELNETALQITAGEYRRNPDQWAHEYTLILNNLLACYINTDSRKALDHGENALAILRALFDRDPNQWVFEYVRLMLNVGYVYTLEKLADQSIAILQQALEILEPLHRQNPMQWVELLNGCLFNLAASYFRYGDVESAISYSQHALDILEPHYRQNPQRWSDTYDQLNGNLTEFKKARNRPGFINPVHTRESNLNRKASPQNAPTRDKHVQHFHNAKDFFKKKWTDRALREYEDFIDAFNNLSQQKQQDDLDWYVEALLDIGIIYHHRSSASNIPAHDFLNKAYNMLCELLKYDTGSGQLLWKATYYYVAELSKSLPVSFFGWRNPKNKVIVEIKEVYGNSKQLYDSIQRLNTSDEWMVKTSQLLKDKNLNT